jgi:hypothetical protein
MNIIEKYLKLVLFFSIILGFNFSYIPKAISINWGELNLTQEQGKAFAEYSFTLGLSVDETAITELYFKNNTEGAKAALLKAVKLYKQADFLDPDHPYARTFAMAHDDFDELNTLVEGDKDAQIAVSGLYADGIEEDVPDNTQIQAFWVLKASQNPGTNMPSAGKQKTNGTWINFIENKLVSMFGSMAAGAVSGFTIGQTIAEQTDEQYWVYIGIGVGSGLGWIAWFSGLNFYNIYHWWTNYRNAKKALQDLDAAFETDIGDGSTIVTFDGEDVINKMERGDLEQKNIDNKEQIIAILDNNIRNVIWPDNFMDEDQEAVITYIHENISLDNVPDISLSAILVLQKQDHSLSIEESSSAHENEIVIPYQNSSGEISIELPQMHINKMPKTLTKKQQDKRKNALDRFKEFVKKHGVDHEVVSNYLTKTSKERIAHKNRFLARIREF